MQGVGRDVVAGVRLVRRAERRALPGLPASRTTLQVTGRVVRSAAAQGVPALVTPAGAPTSRLRRHGLRADGVLVARLRTHHLRVRSFYLGPDPMTMAVQARPWRRSGPDAAGLVVAAAVQQRWSTLDLGRLHVPEVLGRGVQRRHAWVLERMADGAPLTRAQWRERSPEVVAALLQAHGRLGLDVEPVSRHVRGGGVDRLRQLLEHGPLAVRDTLTGAGCDPEKTLDRLEQVLGGDADLVTAVCHGDPVSGNVLLTADGGLVLLDWELAGRRPVVHDVLKALWGHHDVATGFLRLGPLHTGPLLRTGSVLPWPQQGAAVLAGTLMGWQDRYLVAVRSGRERQLRGRVQGQALAMARLLDA